MICRVTARMRDYADWGALGKIAGTRFRGYTTVPVFDIAGARPTGDDLKHLAASLASHGSQAMFHVVGSTPEAGTLEAAVADCDVTAETTIDQNHLDAAFTPATGPRAVQLVVFTAPQLSLAELRTIADLLASRRVHPDVTVIVTANRAVLADADNHGVSVALRDAGVVVVSGTCWYIMQPEVMREQFGWDSVLTNSAKLANVINAQGYTPLLRPTAQCVEAAVRGQLEAA